MRQVVQKHHQREKWSRQEGEAAGFLDALLHSKVMGEGGACSRPLAVGAASIKQKFQGLFLLFLLSYLCKKISIVNNRKRREQNLSEQRHKVCSSSSRRRCTCCSLFIFFECFWWRQASSSRATNWVSGRKNQAS